MSEIPKEKIAQLIDARIDASKELHHIEITVKGLQNSIDEISTKLFFHYKEEDKN